VKSGAESAFQALKPNLGPQVSDEVGKQPKASKEELRERAAELNK